MVLKGKIVHIEQGKTCYYVEFINKNGRTVHIPVRKEQVNRLTKNIFKCKYIYLKEFGKSLRIVVDLK